MSNPNEIEKVDIIIRPFPKQDDAYTLLWDDKTRFLLYGGGAEGGKSWLGAEWLLGNCLEYAGTKWFIGRNELKRLMSSSFATFRKVCAFHQVPIQYWKLNGQYNYIEFTNGSRIDLLDLKFQPSDPMYQRFGSTEYTGGWIEEAGEVNFLAFDVLKSRIGRWENEKYNLLVPKLLLTCNPEQNWLYRIFYKPWRSGNLSDGYAFIQSLWDDNPHTRDQAEKRLNQITDPVLRMRLKEGKWEYASDNNLVDYDAILDLFTNEPAEHELDKKYFTADVARYGSDKITFGRWRGMNLYRITWKTHRGIDQTAQDVKDALRDGRIPYSHAIADDDGVGGGVVDIVKGIKGFVGNAAPLPVKVKHNVQNELKDKRKENYKNMRSQCGFMLAEKINNHEIAITAEIDEPTKNMIIEELQQLKKKELPIEAPLQLIPKEEIKEALGRSPDFSDMMLMRMYFELDRPTTFRQNSNVGGVPGYMPGIDGPGTRPAQDRIGGFRQNNNAGGVDW